MKKKIKLKETQLWKWYGLNYYAWKYLGTPMFIIFIANYYKHLIWWKFSIIIGLLMIGLWKYWTICSELELVSGV